MMTAGLETQLRTNLWIKKGRVTSKAQVIRGRQIFGEKQVSFHLEGKEEEEGVDWQYGRTRTSSYFHPENL